jgi:hypothetical protein
MRVLLEVDKGKSRSCKFMRCNSPRHQIHCAKIWTLFSLAYVGQLHQLNEDFSASCQGDNS